MFLNLFLLLTYCHPEDEKNFIAPFNFQFVIKQRKQWNLSKTRTWKSIMNLSTEDSHVFQITNNILPWSLTNKFTCYSILKDSSVKIQFMQVSIWNKIKDYFTRKHLLLVLASFVEVIVFLTWVNLVLIWVSRFPSTDLLSDDGSPQPRVPVDAARFEAEKEKKFLISNSNSSIH